MSRNKYGKKHTSRNKYGAEKTVFDGEVFDSKKEARRWAELQLMVRAGLIIDLQRQVKYELLPRQGSVRPVFYVADFTYRLREGEKWRFVVEDCKGCRTEVYRLKKKMFLFRYGVEIKET